MASLGARLLPSAGTDPALLGGALHGGALLGGASCWICGTGLDGSAARPSAGVAWGAAVEATCGSGAVAKLSLTGSTGAGACRGLLVFDALKRS